MLRVIEKGSHVAALLFVLVVVPTMALAQDYALAVYAGRLTREKWEKSILPGADFADATIIVATGSWTVARFFGGDLSWELEAQVGKYVGDQDHWEFNLPIIGFRWHRFPWDRYVATSFAWGIGPSYATETPPIELETNDSSSQWLIYWYSELTLGPPASGWEVMLRLHHRSDGYGAVADDGGSNAVCAGLRYRF
ncbi:hypothetical protein [Desulfosarcina sp.]|uniref:hypothetical protein n=1 Tax=Desulfosarcina sp. TaxID=2027861 RepID=UPI00356A25D9